MVVYGTLPGRRVQLCDAVLAALRYSQAMSYWVVPDPILHAIFPNFTLDQVDPELIAHRSWGWTLTPTGRQAGTDLIATWELDLSFAPVMAELYSALLVHLEGRIAPAAMLARPPLLGPRRERERSSPRRHRRSPKIELPGNVIPLRDASTS